MRYSEEEVNESVITITEILYDSEHLLDNSEMNALRICAETLREILSDIQKARRIEENFNQYKLEVYLNGNSEMVLK